MVASFGSGFAFSMVSGITQGNPLQGAFTTGVMFALFQGALHKAHSPPPFLFLPHSDPRVA